MLQKTMICRPSFSKAHAVCISFNFVCFLYLLRVLFFCFAHNTFMHSFDEDMALFSFSNVVYGHLLRCKCIQRCTLRREVKKNCDVASNTYEIA